MVPTILPDEQIDYLGEMFEAARLYEAGLTFEAFLSDPLAEMASRDPRRAPRWWVRFHRVSVTDLVEGLGLSRGYRDNPSRRREGEWAHARFDGQVRRYMGGPGDGHGKGGYRGGPAGGRR